MQKKFAGIMLVIILFALVLPVTSLAAGQLWDNYEVPDTRQKPRLVDQADLLSDGEEKNLLSTLDSLSEKWKCNIVVLTVDSHTGPIQDFADDYYDYNGFGYGDTHDGIILLLVVGAEAGNRDYTIVMTGRGETIFDDDAVYAIEDDILPALRSSNYTTAMARFVRDVEARLGYYDEYYKPVNRTIVALFYNAFAYVVDRYSPYIIGVFLF